MDVFTLMGKITIDIQDALNDIGSVIEKVQELESMLNGTQAAAQTTAEDTGDAVAKSADDVASKTSNTLSKWNVFLGNIATQAANKVYGAGKSFMQTGYEFNANMDLWRSQLQNMLNLDFAGADEFLGRLHQFAIDTPYSMDEVMSNAIMLLGNKKIRESMDIIDLLTIIGNMSNGENEAFGSVAKGIMQVMTKGKVQAEEANQQFAERGIDVWQILADYFSYIDRGGQDEWTADDVSSLGVINPTLMATSEEFMAAMEHAALQDGGFFYGRMDAMMNTATGQAQRMHDAYELAAGSFTKAIFEVFTSDTMPAISNILDKLDKWATENPDALKTLAEAFSSFATNGISVLLDGLTGLINFWNENQGTFKLMTAILGGLLMVTGHPAAGVAMLMASEVSGTEGLDKLYMNEDGSHKTNILFPGLSEQMNNSLPTEDKEAGRYHYFSESARAVAESLWDMERQGLTGQDVSEFEGLMAQAYAEFGKIATELGVTDTEYGVIALLTDLVNQMMTLDKSTENLPDDWFFDPSNSEPIRNPLDMHQIDPNLLVSDAGGNNSMPDLIAAIHSMPEKVTGAISDGISGITITGSITTGDVKLQDGTLVGALAPKLNLRLGWMNGLAMRGDA